MKNDNLQKLEDELKADPTNIEKAKNYWEALDDWQTGSYILECFRLPAIESKEGAVEFSKASLNLFTLSGEIPKKELFDEELIQSLKSKKEQVSGSDKEAIEWVLGYLE